MVMDINSHRNISKHLILQDTLVIKHRPLHLCSHNKRNSQVAQILPSQTIFKP
jgi:hypothetical protein